MNVIRPRRPGFIIALGFVALGLIASTALAACAGGAGSSPEPLPSPTPVVDRITSVQDAAARVAAFDQRFVGIAELDPNMIGASAWWTADPIADGGFRITFVVGWGDCPAGCIDKHQWIFDVTADGAVTLAGESGPPAPSDSIP